MEPHLGHINSISTNSTSDAFEMSHFLLTLVSLSALIANNGVAARFVNSTDTDLDRELRSMIIHNGRVYARVSLNDDHESVIGGDAIDDTKNIREKWGNIVECDLHIVYV